MAGGVFRAEHANDVSGSPGTWVQVGTDTTISGMTNETVYIGLAVTSHNTDPTIACEARFSDVTMTGTIVGDWVNRDIGIQSNKPQKLYVVLQDSDSNAIVYHNDPNILLRNTYTEWRIDLKKFTGVTLSDVRKMYIGIGTRAAAQPGGSGLIYVDQIVLYKPEWYPSELNQRPYDYNFDGLVDEADLDVITNNWLISDYTVTPVAPPFGPVAWYRFEQNTNDSANGFNGDPCGSPAYSVNCKEGSYAIDLNGVNDCVVVGSVGIDGNDARTIAGWVKATAAASAIPDWTNVFGFTGASGTGRHFDIQRRGGQDYYCIHTHGWERNIVPLDQEWHHLAATYNGTTIAWYGDGNFVGSAVGDVNTIDNVQMGKRGDNTNYFPGLIDDVRIYSYALSQSHIGYLAGKSSQYTQPLYLLLTPADPNVNLYDEVRDTIDLLDFAELGKHWSEEQVWPTW
jgi:hypothetical protein